MAKAATKSAKKKKSTSKKVQKKDSIVSEIKGFCLVALGAYGFFCIVANHDPGAIGAVASALLYKFFGGVGQFVLIGAIIINGVLLFKHSSELDRGQHIFFTYILAANALVAIALMDRSMDELSLFKPNFYKNIVEGSSSAGLCGHFLAKLLSQALGRPGAWIVVALASIVAFLSIFRKSIAGAVQNGFVAVKKKWANRPHREKKAKTKLARAKVSPLPVSPDAAKNLDTTEIFAYSGSEKPAIKISPEDAFAQKAPVPAAPAKPKNIFGALARPGTDNYEKPPLSLLDEPKDAISGSARQAEVYANVGLLEKALKDFSIDASVSEVSVGPTVTRYELMLKPGIRVSKVVNLSDDLAMALAAKRVRIEAPIPGKSAIGIEVPNKEVSLVHFSQIATSKLFADHESPLAIALGKDLTGSDLVLDITTMPHLLIAGATGSGKSVCINAMIMSILYHSSPEEVRMILIDPKMVELSVYSEIPHLLIPVVTDPKNAAGALGWAVKEMTKRYEMFAESKVRGIDPYNQKAKEAGKEHMPHIILIIDELNDLMMVSAQQVEASIIRLSQLARAAGIHLVLATQRPSVNVITGVIKANIPTRISFAVMSQVDSRTILDSSGAEKLLGRGDMLYLHQSQNSPIRAQCAYVSDKEIERVVEFVKKKSKADYDEGVIAGVKSAALDGPSAAFGSDDDYGDELLPKAMEIAFEKNIISTSTIQRRLRLGYARAGRIIDEMEDRGYISEADGSKPRKVLITQEEYYGTTFE
ncbi:MAG: DNA translocase FtsK [Eubacteriaceae bacterium]|nr:DNA translocase FtsK [Eubacteriaceae bacterium]